MDSMFLEDVAAALRQGDVALWLGPCWSLPEATELKDELSSVEWLAVWTESKEIETASLLRESVSKTSRRLVEVPDQVEAALGRYYRLAEQCPVFYLNGAGERQDPLTGRQRRISRDAKVDQLERLGPSILVMDGGAQPEHVDRVLSEEIFDAAPELRQIVVTGATTAGHEALLRDLPDLVLAKTEISDKSLTEFLAYARESVPELPDVPAIKVGQDIVPLDRIIRTEPPIDQDYSLVTVQDVRPSEPSEEPADLIRKLLSGVNFNWRPFAHGLDWVRGPIYLERLRTQIARVKEGRSVVACLNIPAEPGSGLTTLLHRLAFDAARSGCPTLFYRFDTPSFSYQLLRSFLTDLYHGVVEPWDRTPAVLIFDASAVQNDSQGAIVSLPRRLARDARRVVLIRGIPVTEVDQAQDSAFRKEQSILRSMDTAEEWLPPLSSYLTSREQEDLTNWVYSVNAQDAAATVASWNQADEPVPLLICLYFILTEDLRSAAGLGKHLVSRLLNYVKISSDAEPLKKATRAKLSGEALFEAARRLRDHFRHGELSERFEDPLLVTQALVQLALLGTLRLSVPRAVLSELLDAPISALPPALTALVRLDLALLSESKDRFGQSERLAPSAFYHRTEVVGIRHPIYGRLILEWLGSKPGKDDLEQLTEWMKDDSLLEMIDWSILESEFPVQLLRPILSALKPLPESVEFAAEVSTRYLRYQKRDLQPSLSTWQWRHMDVLIEAFTWLDENLMTESPTLLHSRGITTYKSCGQVSDVHEWRKRYETAVDDFEHAIDLSVQQEDRGENPANIRTSLGLLLVGWARKERDANFEHFAQEIDERAENTLRRALDERQDNPFAAFGLARFLVTRCGREVDRAISEGEEAGYAKRLVEAIDLLQAEPEPYFSDEWTELKREAIQLLSKDESRRIVRALCDEGDELGAALQALFIMQGEIPCSASEGSPVKVREAYEVLTEIQSTAKIKRQLADFLRYCLFSSLPERSTDPAYRQRREMLERLIGSLYFYRPVILYDYAMLSYQVREFRDGNEAYRHLRRGQRFFEVPGNRVEFLVEDPDSDRRVPEVVRLRIVDRTVEGVGWALAEEPDIEGRVKFAVRAFEGRNKPTQIGATTTASIRLDAAGPFAVPERPDLQRRRVLDSE